MNPVPGYNEAPAYTGEVMQLPAGLYVCIVKQVNVQNDTAGKEQMIVCFDIAEGEQKGFYQKQYEARKQNSANAKWGGVHRQFTHDKGLPFFKGMICSIEKSNNGYKWDWNEKELIGKKLGVVFQEEEYIKNDGSVGVRLIVNSIKTVEQIVNGDSKIPDRKKVAVNNQTATNDNFVKMDGSDDLPF